MRKEDIKTLTIVGSEVIINGVSNTINLSLANDIEAVQYHKGHRMLEEPLMKEVEFEKYQEFIDEWQKIEDIKNIIKVLTTEEIEVQRIAEAKAYLAKTDYKMLPNYVPKPDEDLDAIIVKRNETREFIRANEE